MASLTRRSACILLTLALFCGLLPPRARAVEVSATAAILVDAASGTVLYEKEADRKMLIASTTKILTALTALRYGTLSDTVTVSRRAANTEGSSMYLRQGEQLTLEALLYGLLLASGNDAGVAIAEHIGGGSEAAFVARMNEIASELGMNHSSFANPHGLDHKDHYSTARDMAKLANAAMDDPIFRRMVSTRSITVGNRTLTNHNKLLGMVEGCVGLKTGYTRAAGRTLVTCVERDGRRLIVVTLQDGNDWVDHQSLYEYGFSIPPAPPEPAPWVPRTTTALASAGQYLGEAMVDNGQWPSVPLMAAGELSFDLAEGEQVAMWIEYDKRLSAPVEAGQWAGTAVYSVNGVEIGRVGALCAVSVPLGGASLHFG